MFIKVSRCFSSIKLIISFSSLASQQYLRSFILSASCTILVRYLSGTCPVHHLFPELNLKRIPNLLEDQVNLRVFLKRLSHFLESCAPRFDQIKTLEDRRQNAVSDFRSSRSEFFNGKCFRQMSGTCSFEHTIKDRYLYVVSKDRIITVNDSVCNRFTNGFKGIFPSLFAIYFTDLRR